jgi:hypothetical protein
MSDVAPDHLCYEVARASVERFVMATQVITCPIDQYYCATWPLPAGYQAMIDWLGKQEESELNVSTEWLAHPLVEEPTAYIGLAAVRYAKRGEEQAGSMWLLGLMERVWPDQPPADADGTLLRRHIEELRYARENPSYRFVSSAWRIEGDYADFRKEIENLSRWYTKNLMGIVMGGRPHGSGTFADGDEFLSAVRKAIEALDSFGRKPTQKAVADHFSYHPGFPACSARQLRRWCKLTPYRDWEELVKSLRG